MTENLEPSNLQALLKRKQMDKNSAIRNPQSVILMEIYQRLYTAFGPRHWWPGETPFEVMVGAILTQHTAWKNVEKAIQNLRGKGVLHSEGIHRLRKSQLASLIKPSGFYRIKADRLKVFVDVLFKEWDGDTTKMGKEPLEALRPKLLKVKGIGPETADSILLYGLKKPIFVVDAYTQRIFSRHKIISEKATYEEIQHLLMYHLPIDEKLFNEYHALIVHLGKTVCKKIPGCDRCPIQGIEQEA